MPELRGHHLLCILNYGGAGYTPEFIANMTAVVDRITRGEPIRIVVGSDDICGVLRRGGYTRCDHARKCRAERTAQRDRLALRDVARALHLSSLKPGDVICLRKTDVRRLRQLFARGAVRRACVKCPWHERCTQRATGGFVGAKLFPV